MVQLCARVAAIEFVVAAQAIDLRSRPTPATPANPAQLGVGTARAYRMIRELIPFTQGDGSLPADLEPLVTTGTLNPTPRVVVTS
jgi:histidine ammonia-lyase